MSLHWRKCALAALLIVAAVAAAAAQQARPPATPQPPAMPQLPMPKETPGVFGKTSDPFAVPGFWDPRRRPERPDLTRISVIRFLTETDYPPFNFTGADGNPAGFNVDLARSLCDEIKVTCTIQMRRFETLLDAITSNRGDAII